MIDAILGLDIDEEFFVACLLLGESKRSRKFRNAPRGFGQLIEWLTRAGIEGVFACMEATGRYGEKLAKFLHSQGFKVVVVNPAFIASHKATLNKHNKTDPTDAGAIADYVRCFRTKLRVWEPRCPAHEALMDVMGQLLLVKKSITAFSNRRDCGLNSERVHALTEETIDHLRSQLKRLEHLRDELFAELPELQEVREVLNGIPGCGEEIADALAAKIRFADFRNGRSLASFLGLGSREWKSGKQRRRGKQTKAGDKQLRSVLRMGAMSAIYQSKCPIFREFATRLRKQGLQEKQIITAVARKIVLIAHALVRRKERFDREYSHPLAAKSA